MLASAGQELRTLTQVLYLSKMLTKCCHGKQSRVEPNDYILTTGLPDRTGKTDQNFPMKDIQRPRLKYNQN